MFFFFLTSYFALIIVVSCLILLLLPLPLFGLAWLGLSLCVIVLALASCLVVALLVSCLAIESYFMFKRFKSYSYGQFRFITEIPPLVALKLGGRERAL